MPGSVASGTPCIYIYIYKTILLLSRLGGNPGWTTVGHHMGMGKSCKYSWEFLMMSGMPLKTC